MPYTILLTRPAHRNRLLARQLRAKGWQAVELPALALTPRLPQPEDFPLPNQFDAVVFVSSYAARVYLEALQKLTHHAPWPSQTLAVTVGQASAKPLYQAGLIPESQIVHPDAEQGGHDSEALWARLQSETRPIRRVLVLRGQTGREWLGAQFERVGAEVTRLAIYHRHPAIWSGSQRQQLAEILQQPDKAIMLLTSSEGVRALHGKLGRLGLLPAWAATRFIAYHQRIATQLQSILQESCLSLQHPVMLCEPSDTAFCQMLDTLRRQHGRSEDDILP